MMSSNCIVRTLGGTVRRFRRDDSGLALLEFAVVLPMMLLTFALIVEGSRIMLAYNSTINGVRDATRYLARVIGPDACVTHPSVAGYANQLTTMVRQGGGTVSIFPASVSLDSLTPSYRCVTGTYRGGVDVPVAQVSTVITINFPFGGIFTLVGASRATLTTRLADQARIYGS